MSGDCEKAPALRMEERRKNRGSYEKAVSIIAVFVSGAKRIMPYIAKEKFYGKNTGKI